MCYTLAILALSLWCHTLCMGTNFTKQYSSHKYCGIITLRCIDIVNLLLGDGLPCHTLVDITKSPHFA